MRRFEDLVGWQKARLLSREIYRAANEGGFARDAGLRGQICRASVSVMSNIAEGFGRYSRAEFRRFLVIARGSAAEVRSQLYVALDLGYISIERHTELLGLCLEVDHLLSRLRGSLDKPN